MSIETQQDLEGLKRAGRIVRMIIRAMEKALNTKDRCLRTFDAMSGTGAARRDQD